MKLAISPEQRIHLVPLFWSNVGVGKLGHCWEWKRSAHPKGYGYFNIEGKTVKSHRIAWALEYGKIGDKALVLHKCNNPRCCNPRHLYLGDNKDNARDRELAKRGVNSRKILCKRGHFFRGKNLIITSQGARQCYECNKLRNRRFLRRNKK